MGVLPVLKKEECPQVRILNDKSIIQAIQMGLIKITPDKDIEKDAKRVQPATLDVKIGKDLTLPSKKISEITLTEKIECPAMEDFSFLTMFCEARSSVRRLGCYIPYQGRYFSSRGGKSQIKLGNFSHNQVHFKEGDRIAQLFFKINPCKEISKNMQHESLKETIEKIESLETGELIHDPRKIEELQQKGLFEITSKTEMYKGLVKVHASREAYRLKRIKDGIHFNKRKEYSKDDLLEKIDISKGYRLQPNEHIIIETIEKIKLSPHIGMRFWDNLPSQVYFEDPNLADKLDTYVLTDGWIDPGYNGNFSRQPKWWGKTIYPGDVIGFGQVFYFPDGVGNAYGSEKLGSQYQNHKETKFSK